MGELEQKYAYWPLTLLLFQQYFQTASNRNILIFLHHLSSNETNIKVKNKNAAPIQISAEQILREAAERQEVVAKAPHQIIQDEDELQQYRLRKRTTFEQYVKTDRHNIQTWIRYAAFEDSQKEFAR